MSTHCQVEPIIQTIYRDTHFKSTLSGHGGNRRTLQIEELVKNSGYDIYDIQFITQKKKDKNIREQLQHLYDLIFTTPKYLHFLHYIAPEFKRYYRSAIKLNKSTKHLKEPRLSNVILWESSLNFLLPYFAKSIGMKTIALPHNFDSLAGSGFNPQDASTNLNLLRGEIKHLAKADSVFCISREEQWFLRLCDIQSDYLPYYPTDLILHELLKIRVMRDSNHTNTNHGSKSLLIFGTFKNKPTRVGMVELINWLNEYKGLGYYDVYIAGFHTEEIVKFTDLNPSYKLLGTLNDEQFSSILANVNAVLIHQPYGLGAITKIPEMLIAGVPVILNNIAARSYHHIHELNIYNDKNELYNILDSDIFQSPTIPERPIAHEIRFINTLKKLASQ